MARWIYRPDALICLVWIAFVLAYLSAPLDYVHAPGIVAWSVMASGLLAFCCGSLGVTLLSRKVTPQTAGDVAHLDAIVTVCAIAGLVGSALIAIDKVFLSGQDWSIGMTALRERRAVEVVEGVAINRSVLLYLGYLTFSFSCASVCLFLLKGEELGRWTGRLAQISALAVVAYSLVYGGRMPILLLLVLAISCGIVRRLQGRSLVASGWYLWPKLMVFGAGFIAYTNLIWQRRRVVNLIDSYDVFLRLASARWEVEPSAWFDAAVRTGKISANTAMDLISDAMYLTHSPTTLQRLIEHWFELPAFWGLYQIGILSPLFDVFAPGLKAPDTMRADLARTGLFGWFPGAWAACLLDGGIVFGTLMVVVWGALSGAAFAAVIRTGSLAAQLMLVFAYTTIFVSPLNGPFGVANSFLVFCSFAVVAIWMKLSLRRQTLRQPRGYPARSGTDDSA